MRSQSYNFHAEYLTIEMLLHTGAYLVIYVKLFLILMETTSNSKLFMLYIFFSTQVIVFFLQQILETLKSEVRIWMEEAIFICSAFFSDDGVLCQIYLYKESPKKHWCEQWESVTCKQIYLNIISRRFRANSIQSYPNSDKYIKYMCHRIRKILDFK